MAERRKLWHIALVIAAGMGVIRLISDAAIPPHLHWWLTPAVAFVSSILTSVIWFDLRRSKRPEDADVR